MEQGLFVILYSCNNEKVKRKASHWFGLRLLSTVENVVAPSHITCSPLKGLPLCVDSRAKAECSGISPRTIALLLRSSPGLALEPKANLGKTGLVHLKPSPYHFSSSSALPGGIQTAGALLNFMRDKLPKGKVQLEAKWLGKCLAQSNTPSFINNEKKNKLFNN